MARICKTVTSDELLEMQNNHKNIRNVSILAHVDHGKTTFADNLIASNELIPRHMIGEIRYMDSRKDEQERGITMKSSSIALKYQIGSEKYLINLIDSPGHMDFSFEVSCAINLTDGALVLVDVVEGPYCQTCAVIRQALMQNIKMILVVNKIDRLFTHLGLSAIESYHRIVKVVEKTNAIIADFLISTSTQDSTEQSQNEMENYFDPIKQKNVIFCSSTDGWAFDIAAFSGYFSKKLKLSQDELFEKFWGNHFYDPKQKNIQEGALERNKPPLFSQLIVGTIYEIYTTFKSDATTERDRQLKILTAIFNIDREKPFEPKIQRWFDELLNNKTPNRVFQILSNWMPLSNCTLKKVIETISPPGNFVSMKSLNQISPDPKYISESNWQKLVESVSKCSAKSDDPVLVYISKLVSYDIKCLPGDIQNSINCDISVENCNGVNKSTSLYEGKAAIMKNDRIIMGFSRVCSGILKSGTKLYVCPPKSTTNDVENMESIIDDQSCDQEDALFMSTDCNFTSDKLEISRNCDDFKNKKSQTIDVIAVYVMMGSSLEKVEYVSSGNVCAIQFISSKPFKTATLCSYPFVPDFTTHQNSLHVGNCISFAIEPVLFKCFQTVAEALKSLSMFDPALKLSIQDTGELILKVRGKVHLDRLLEDLKEILDETEFELSSPMVPFRECLVSTDFEVDESKLDKDTLISLLPVYLQDFFQDITVIPAQKEYHQRWRSRENIENNLHCPDISKRTFEEIIPMIPGYCSSSIIQMYLPNINVEISVKTLPIPNFLVQLFCNNIHIINKLNKERIRKHSNDGCNDFNDEMNSDNSSFFETILSSIKNNLSPDSVECEFWKRIVANIWAFGPRGCGSNILVDDLCHQKHIDDQSSNLNLNENDYFFSGRTFHSEGFKKSNIIMSPVIRHGILSGFQLATQSGPLMEEPMMGICYILESIKYLSIEKRTTTDPLTNSISKEYISGSTSASQGGSVVSSLKRFFRAAYLSRIGGIRIGLLYDKCKIRASMNLIGKIHQVLLKRNAIEQSEDSVGVNFVEISALLPVVQSYEFSSDLLTETCGFAVPEIKPHGWKILESFNPLYFGDDPDDDVECNDKNDNVNRTFDSIFIENCSPSFSGTVNQANKYLVDIRKRKGLPVGQKTVVHAEKQRTLKRNK